MDVSISALSERIRIVHFSTILNEYGDIVKVEEIERCQVWADIDPLNAKIDDVTPERQNQITYRVIIRRRTDILPDDEIIWRGKRLKLLSPPYAFKGERRFICMNCIEIIQDSLPISNITVDCDITRNVTVPVTFNADTNRDLITSVAGVIDNGS